jgi:hypothetical protein
MPSLGVSRLHIANSLSILGRHSDALESAEAAFNLQRRVLPPDHPDIGDKTH